MLSKLHLQTASKRQCVYVSVSSEMWQRDSVLTFVSLKLDHTKPSMYIITQLRHKFVIEVPNIAKPLRFRDVYPSAHVSPLN